MKPTRYGEREFTESLYRHGVPALAWVALFAFFAFAGASYRDEPRQIAKVAPALRPMASETAGVPATALNAPSAREPAPRDAAVVAHEALDPVGVGRNTTP